jgi:hypothetical protein
MAAVKPETEPAIQWVTPEEARAIFDQYARQILDISGEEFLRRWDAGEYRDAINGPDHLKLMRLVMLMPFGRADT